VSTRPERDQPQVGDLVGRLEAEAAAREGSNGSARLLERRLATLEAELESERTKATAAASKANRLKGKLQAGVEERERLQEELRVNKEEGGDWRRRAADAQARLEAFERQLAIRGEELEAARRSLARKDAEVERRGEELAADFRQREEKLSAELRQREKRLDSDHARLQQELNAATAEREEIKASLDGATVEQNQLREQLHAKETERKALKEQLVNEVARLQRELDEANQLSASHLAQLQSANRRLDHVSLELEAICTALEQAAGSKSWRYGHGTMRFFKRLTFRKPQERGALDIAAERARRLQESAGRPNG
jgi:chromosome segregation ATPase